MKVFSGGADLDVKAVGQPRRALNWTKQEMFERTVQIELGPAPGSIFCRAFGSAASICSVYEGHPSCR